MKYTGLHISVRGLIGLLFILLMASFVLPDLPNEPNDPANNSPHHPEFFHKKNITDGPYVFYENNKIIVRWIKGEELVSKVILGNSTKYLKKNFGIKISIENLTNPVNTEIDYTQEYKNIENFVVISDVHGQFNLFVELLQHHQVIDKNLHWIYGNGHLVVLGDIFDRGDKVTEILWLVYQLEQEAKTAGGKLHYMLGNHELMVLHKDLRYINEKYILSANKMKMSYSGLFAENTFFGQWIRSKPTIITINDNLFVHAGISEEFIARKLTAEKVNYLFNNKILNQPWDSVLLNPLNSMLVRKNGPLWHRGFFDGRTSEAQVDKILAHFNTKHIIIGHTSMPNIISIMGGKIIGVDADIKEGNSGEILIYRKGEFYRGTSKGSIMKLEP